METMLPGLSYWMFENPNVTQPIPRKGMETEITIAEKNRM
jgi:hypothetical protein